MAARTFELWMTDDFGTRLADADGHSLLTTALWWSCSRVVNGIGWFEMGLPKSFDTTLIKLDHMVQIWRAPQGGRLSLWRVYFLRRWRYETGEDGTEFLTISGPDVNDLLRRRIVAAYAGSTHADKRDYADDMMKEIVSEATSDTVPPTPDAGTRVWNDLSVAADLSDGPTLDMAFAWRPLMTPSGGGVLPDIAAASKEAGTEVFFDIVPSTISGAAITFEFRTYTGQPGMDLTGLGVFFDEARGNMKSPFLEYDYSNEVNYVYAGGQEVGRARNIQQVYDSDRYGLSQWNRCEAFADARNQTNDDAVREAARSKPREDRPRIRFGAWAQDTRGMRFGLDWNHGDKVRARYRGEEFDAIIRSTVISMNSSGQEVLQARLEYED